MKREKLGYRTPERVEKTRWVLEHRQKDLALVLANIHDPHNVSAIYRSCDAFGIPEVHLLYTDTPFPTLAAKSSASAKKWVDSVRHKSAVEMAQHLKGQGMKIYATNCTAKARPLGDFDLTGPCAIVMGNEHGGVSEDILQLADEELYIPMYGMIQSFNVSVAAAVILAEASRQRLAKGMYDKPTYTEDELVERFDLWSKK